MGEPWCLWGAEQGRIRHTACRGVGGPSPAVGAGHGVGWGWEGLVGVGGREKGRSRGKRSGPGGSGMQSEQCYRQWRKCRKGGGGAGQVRVAVVAGRGWGGVGRGGRSGAEFWGLVACGGGGCVLLPVSYYEEVMRVKTAWGLRPESLGRGNGALAAGYPRLGWPGCPGAPWGRRLPTSAGCETSACSSVPEGLRIRPQELTRRGDCGPGRPRGMITNRKWGARMSPAVGTCLRPGGGRCPGLLPLPCARWRCGTPQPASVPGAVGTDPSWGRV